MPLHVGRRTLVASLLAPALGLPAIARAQTVRQLKMTLADTVASPVYGVCQRFAANLKQKSGGSLDVQVYGAGQLGSQANALTSLQTGIVDFVAHTSGYMETIFPKIAVLDLPFVFPNAKAAEAVLDGPVGAELFKPFPDRGIYGLCWGHWGWRPISTAAPEAVTEPAKMSGVKIRLQPGAIYAETYKAIGAIPTAIDLSEVYLALSQGAVQAIELPFISMVANKMGEVVKHSNDCTMFYNAGALMVSKRRMDAFTPEQKDAVHAAAKEMSVDWRNTLVTATEAAATTLKAAGVTITQVDTAAYKAATRPIYDKFRPIIGDELVDQVLKQVGT